MTADLADLTERHAQQQREHNARYDQERARYGASSMPRQNVWQKSRSAAVGRKKRAQSLNEAGTAGRRQNAHAERLSLLATKAEPLPPSKGCRASLPGIPLLVRNGDPHAGAGASTHRRVGRRAQAGSGETAAAGTVIAVVIRRSHHLVEVSEAGAAAPETAEGFQTYLIA